MSRWAPEALRPSLCLGRKPLADSASPALDCTRYSLGAETDASKFSAAPAGVPGVVGCPLLMTLCGDVISEARDAQKQGTPEAAGNAGEAGHLDKWGGEREMYQRYLASTPVHLANFVWTRFSNDVLRLTMMFEGETFHLERLVSATSKRSSDLW